MLVYLLAHASREAAEKSFADFRVDPDWVKARTASEERAGGSLTEPQGGVVSEFLVPHFDIHGGGLDLVFPHHENEIAQSESLHDCPMATFWMHNGLMQAAGAAGKVGGRPRGGDASADDAAAQAATKISKSTGAEPFKNLLTRHDPHVIRMLLVSTH
jgi:cysteinyl-tRNA synthetase